MNRRNIRRAPRDFRPQPPPNADVDIVIELESISPASGTVFGGDLVTLRLKNGGASLVESVTFDGMAPITEFEIISELEIRLVTPAYVIAGDYAITTAAVIIDAGDYGPLVGEFTFTSPVSISLVSPDSDLNPAGGEVIEVTGAGFDLPEIPLTGLQINGVEVDIDDVTIVDDSRLSFTSPADMQGSGGLILRTDAGMSNVAAQYSPISLSVFVNEFPGESVGTVPLVWTGGGFTGCTGVGFAGIGDGTSFSVVSDSEIHVTAPFTLSPDRVDVVLHFSGYDVVFSDAWGVG